MIYHFFCIVCVLPHALSFITPLRSSSEKIVSLRPLIGNKSSLGYGPSLHLSPSVVASKSKKTFTLSMTKNDEKLNEVEDTFEIVNDDQSVPASSKKRASILNPMSFVVEKKEQFSAAAKEGFGTKAKNVATSMRVGDIVVPLCGNLTQRQILANRGIYPGVEYEVCYISSSVNNATSIAGNDDEELVALIKPAYKLKDYLERNDWPVSVRPLEDVPLWVSKTTYEAGTMFGTLGLSLSYLTTAAVLAFLLTFAYVPSESMIPTLKPGNVVLVSRSLFTQPKVGDVILFDPPSNLITIMKQNNQKNTIINDESSSPSSSNTASKGITNKQQFLKRVVAIPGEFVGVKNSNPYIPLNNNDEDKKGKTISSSNSDTIDVMDENTNDPNYRRKYRVDVIGSYIRPDIFPSESWNKSPEQLGKNEFFVAGDNGFRSVDSRVWGSLDRKYIFGTAKFVIWPLQDFGPIQNGNIFEVEK